MFFMGKKLKARGQDVKLSPLEFMILLKVYEADPVGISGYDLISDLTSTFAGMWVAQSGTIYPLLSRMQEKRLLVAADVKSELGPVKKVFKLTPLSREIIEPMILDNFEPELQFFGNYLDFACRMLGKLKEKQAISVVNVDQARQALVLFGSRLDAVQEQLDGIARRGDAATAGCCASCKQPVDASARFCPACGLPTGPR